MAQDALRLTAHYKPRTTEGEPFSLSLKVPGSKTVEALLRAWAKAVSKSPRGYGLSIDTDNLYITKSDETYIRPETRVADAFADREEIRIRRRDDVPEAAADTTNWSKARPTAFWIANNKDDGGI